MKYNLEERTAKFAEDVIGVLRNVLSGSIGANYNEANEGESKKDFYHKVSIAKKEIKETMHWLRLMAKAQPEISGQLRPLWSEAHELILIFSKILSHAKVLR